MSREPLGEVCGNCGLSLGSHRADSICYNQCPQHEGHMDWPVTGVSTFLPTGRFAIPQPSKVSNYRSGFKAGKYCFTCGSELSPTEIQAYGDFCCTDHKEEWENKLPDEA